MKNSLLTPCVTEASGTFALVCIGIGAIHHLGGMDKNGGTVGIARAHGLTIAVVVSAAWGISGGHLNPALTFG